MDKKATRTESLHLRLTPSEMKTIQRGAKLDERTVADWARRTLLTKARTYREPPVDLQEEQ